MAQPAALPEPTSGSKFFNSPNFAGFLPSRGEIHPDFDVGCFSSSPACSWGQNWKTCFNGIVKGLKEVTIYYIPQKSSTFVVNHRPHPSQETKGDRVELIEYSYR